MALIQYLTHIQFDFGAVRLLQAECDRIGIKRPMVVTDQGIQAVGILDAALSHLDRPDAVPVFDATPPNPNEEAVRQAVAVTPPTTGTASSPLAAARPSTLPKAWPCATHEGR